MSLPFAASVRALLLADAGVRSALPGGIHPDQIPQEARLPAMAYATSSEPIQSLSSGSVLPAIRFGTLSVTAVCRTAAESMAIDAALERVLLANRAKATVAGYEIHRLLYSGMTFENEFLSDGDDESYRKLSGTITGFICPG